MLKAKQLITNLLLAFICLSPTQVKAQKLKFQSLGIESGLPANEVYNLYQDEKGYVWAFTEYGMVKHNGTRFIPVCKNLPFEESSVYTVRESANKEIYIANSKAHIYKIKNDSAILVGGIEKISHKIVFQNETIYDMLIDDSSNIFFSTFDNSYELEKKSGKVIELSPLYKDDSVSAIYKKMGKNYFFIKPHFPVSTNNYFKIIDEQNRTVLKMHYPNRIDDRTFLREANGNYYFMSTYDVRFRDKKGVMHITSFQESTVNMEVAPNGHLWVGGRTGLYELDANLNILNHYFSNLIITDVLFDRQGGMWVSSIENGVYYCKSIYTAYYDNVPELSFNITMMKRIGNKLFIGTGNGSLYLQENNTFRKIDLKNYNYYINDITFYNDQYLIGTKNAVLTLDKDFKLLDNGNNFKNIDSRVMTNCYGFGPDRNDTLIFISAGVVLKKYKSELCLPAYKTLFKTRSILERSAHNCLIGTTKGLFLLNNNVYIPEYLKALETKIITRLKSDSKKNIWICTKGSGLYVLTPGNQLIKIKNVPTSVINDISFVNDTTFLLSTNKGLYISASRDQSMTAPWRLLYDNETIFSEVYQDEVFIATKQGLVTLNTKALFQNIVSPLYLESVTVNNQKIGCSDIKLNYSQNDLYFNFDILEYGKNDPSFFYQLEGPYSDKGKVSGTTLHLQNLQPGYYQLYVYLTDENDVKKNMYFIPFYIHPAFWQTNFFILELVITVIAFCIFFTGYFYDRLKKRQEHKTMITRLLIEQRLTALKAQINPHFISNSLTGIQQLILENKIDKANQYIAKFSLLIRYTLNYSDKSAALLSNEIDIIDLNIELEKLRFSDKFIFEKQIADNVNINDFFIPPLITQPLIENAIWHGLLPLKDHRIPTLVLKIELANNKLIISIIDNGVGRTKKEETNKPNARESKGVWLVMNRIGNLNRLHPFNKSELLFTDLLTDDGQPAGTKVDLIFPLIVLENLYDDKNEDHNY